MKNVLLPCLCLLLGLLGCQDANENAAPTTASPQTPPAGMPPTGGAVETPAPVEQTPAQSTVSIDGYTLPTSTVIKPAQEITKGFYLSRDGKLPLASDKEPFLWFQVIPKLPVPSDTAAYAKQNLESLSSITDVVISSQLPVQIAGISGTKTIAEAVVPPGNEPILVYFINLHGPEGAVMLRGLVGRDDPENYMQEFDRLATGLTKAP